MTAPAFRLAGSGWYETDFKKEGDRKRNLAGKDEPPKAEGAGKDKPSGEAGKGAGTSPAPAAAAPAKAATPSD